MRNPLFHIVRRRDIPWWKSLLFRVIAIIIAFVIVCGMISATSGENPAMIIPYLFEGSFGTVRKVYSTFRMMSLLLIVGLALVPAFKMKFWNLGGDGQMLMGCLCAIMCMVHLGDLGWPDWAIILVEIPAAILGGIIWALIPAIFKAFFNTNESLLTLMLNYIAVAVVGVYLTATVKNGSGTMSPVTTGALAIKFGPHQFDYLPIIVAVVLLALVFAYLRFHKHGYELAVVGESQNTAKYIGINVKKVIIRTVILSGAICGIVGLLLATSINHSITSASSNNMGFTAIMIAWLAKFNPLAMVGTSFLVAFVNTGMKGVQTAVGITSDAITSVSIGLIYFAVIAADFFVSYRIMLSKHTKEPSKKAITAKKEKDLKEGK